jgi:hypothetical protein
MLLNVDLKILSHVLAQRLKKIMWLIAYSGVQPIALCFCFGFLRFVCPMLPVSLGCPFLIAPSVFSVNTDNRTTQKPKNR